MKVSRGDFNLACIKLFKSMVIDPIPRPLEMEVMDTMALLQGVVIEPSLKTSLTEDDFSSIMWNYGRNAFNLNQTFHKSLETVSEISKEEHYFKQFLHYMTTYGFEALGIEGDYVYIPNEKLELPEDTIPIKPILIKSITVEDLTERVKSMLASGIAMKKETVNSLIDIIKYLDIHLELNDIANREVRCIVCAMRNIPVTTSDDALRVLNYIIFNDAMVVRSFRDMKKIKLYLDMTEVLDKVYDYFSALPVEVIAKDFNKNRNLWFGYRARFTDNDERNQKVAYIRNKINRASRINKVREQVARKEIPTLDNFSSFLNAEPAAALYEYAANDFEIINKETNLYKLVKFMNYLRETMLNSEYKVYRVRNGKSYVVKTEEKLMETSIGVTCNEMQKVVKQRIMALLLERIGNKKIFIPKNVEYSVPTSEKQFIRGIPEGTKYKFEDNAIVAIHWNNILEDGREYSVDLDLKAYGDDTIVGWDYNFRSENRTDVLFSGDITDAPIKKGGATEAIYFNRDVESIFSIMVNNYNNSVECPFEIIFEDTDKSKDNKFTGDKTRCNSIIDNRVANKLTSVAKKNECSQMTIGLYMDNAFWFSETNLGSGRSAVQEEFMDNYLQAIKAKYKSRITLNELLDNLGLLVENKEDADLDLSLEAITDDTFIDLFKDKE